MEGSYVYATTSPRAGMSRSKRHGLTSCTAARLCWMNFADAKRPRCWQVSVASAACGWRRSCRAPRWGETRHLFPSKPSSSGRVDGGLARGPLQAWRACARCEASSERGPIAFHPSNFDRAPAEPGRSGCGSAGHVTARQSPVRPAARDADARNARRATAGQSAAGKPRRSSRKKIKRRQQSPSPDTSPPTPSTCPACSATDTPGGM